MVPLVDAKNPKYPTCMLQLHLCSSESFQTGTNKEMATKLSEFETLTSAEEAGNSTLHGVILGFSPMKIGTKAKYLEAKLTDGDEELRVVGF